MKNEEDYNFSMTGNEISYDFRNEEKIEKFKPYFEEWVKNSGFDLSKVKKITALIYLNMSPMHDKSLDKLLFFHSITELAKNFEKNDQ